MKYAADRPYADPEFDRTPRATKSHATLEPVVKLEKLGVTLELRDIYAGLEFRPRPKLVELPTGEPSGSFRPK
jgi:hypothetical protein